MHSMNWPGNRAQAAATAAARSRCAGGDADRASGGSNSRAGSDDMQSSRALDDFRIRCPNCSHQFTLSEGLLMEEEHLADGGGGVGGRGAGEAASAEMADTAHGSLESLAMDGGAPACVAGGFKRAAGQQGCSDAFDTFENNDAASPSALDCGGGNAASPPEVSGGGGGGGGGGGEDSKSSTQPVSRCYQILNWTVEELEKVICDPNDRRIRKISSISQCDIEVRSEMASTRFGASKNYCILRAAQAGNVDQCRSLLKRQLLWVLKPKTQEGESASPSR